jgi:hypothetical protein
VKRDKNRGRMMASVIRVSHGGGAAVEESHLTIEQAQSMAKSHLRNAVGSFSTVIFSLIAA